VVEEQSVEVVAPGWVPLRPRRTTVSGPPRRPGRRRAPHPEPCPVQGAIRMAPTDPSSPVPSVPIPPAPPAPRCSWVAWVRSRTTPKPTLTVDLGASLSELDRGLARSGRFPGLRGMISGERLRRCASELRSPPSIAQLTGSGRRGDLPRAGDKGTVRGHVVAPHLPARLLVPGEHPALQPRRRGRLALFFANPMRAFVGRMRLLGRTAEVPTFTTPFCQRLITLDANR
jgi:hypothetical protein